MSENNAFKEFAFEKHNYQLMLIGIVIVIFGFFLMSGGGSDDPNVFEGDYSLTEDSFTQLTEEFDVDEAIISKLKSIEGQVFEGEIELKEKMSELLGEEDLQKNYYPLRSVTHIEADMFNTRRLTVAPIVVLFGYAFIMYAIMKKSKTTAVITEE